MESDNLIPPLQKQTKAIHWRSAMLALFRLKNSEGLVDDAVVGALKITLHPPSFSITLSPELKGQIDSYMSSDFIMRAWQRTHEQVAEEKRHPLNIAGMYCTRIGQQYICNLSKRSEQSGGGYWLWE